MGNDRARQVNEFPTLLASPLSDAKSPRTARLRHCLVLGSCLLPVVAFLGLFFVGPIAVNLVQSLHPVSSETASLSGFTKLLSDGYFYKVLFQTVALGIGVTFFCLLFGYPFAYGLRKTTGKTRAVLMMSLLAPLLVNVVVRSYGWMILIGGGGVLDVLAKFFKLDGLQLMYTWTGITIALVHVLLAFMVISISSQLESLDGSYEEAAATLGASPGRAFIRVILPLTLEGVVTGAIITFTMTIVSFVTVMLLGDNSDMVLPLLIYQQLTVTNDWAAAAALGILLLCFILAILWMRSSLRVFFKRRNNQRRIS